MGAPSANSSKRGRVASQARQSRVQTRPSSVKTGPKSAAKLLGWLGGSALAILLAGTIIARLQESRRPAFLRSFPSPKLTRLPQFQGSYQDEMLWGTYRPGFYFGMRTREPESLLFGLMWVDLTRRDWYHTLRHEAQERDGLEKYGWIEHDGSSYGLQQLRDRRYDISTAWTKRRCGPACGRGGDWAVRVTAVPNPNFKEDGSATGAHGSTDVISLFFYVHSESGAPVRVDRARLAAALSASDASDGNAAAAGGRASAPRPLLSGNGGAGRRPWTLFGASQGPASFPVGVHTLGLRTPHSHNVTEAVKQGIAASLMAQRNAAASSYTLRLPDTEEPRSNLVVVQVIAWLPLRLDLALLGEAIGKTAWNAAGPEGGAPDRQQTPVVSLLDPDEDPQQPDPHLQPSNPRPTKKHPSRAKRIAIWASQEERARRLTGAQLDARLARASRRWQEQFAARFGDWEAAGSLPPAAAQAARAGVSNLLGGVGYWHGAPLVKVHRTGAAGTAAEDAPLLEPGVEAPLYSAVPSRSFFPRGFLWDEGFHQLLLRRWRPQQSRDVLAHWLDTQAADGWIAREQIRGREAHARVPDEFVPQLPDAANPPTLFLVLRDMARGLEAQDADGLDAELALDREFLSAAWPRLTAWYRWFNTSQAGELPGSFRWRGRDARAAWELNPKTLTSGLDDYPRASHPDAQERHVDLRCWMELAAAALASVGESLGAPAALLEPFRRDAQRLGDWEELQRLHYDPDAERFRDWGRHTEDLALVRRVDDRGVEDAQRAPVSRALAQEAGEEAGGRRGVLDARRVAALDKSPGRGDVGDADVELSAARLRRPAPPTHGWVPHTGYVSLFPLALGLIPADSPVLASQIELVGPRGELASPAGLRSLSASSSLYRAHNTLHDGPYWRGPVWVNINVLVLQSLGRYARQGGPHAEAAREAHAALRRSLLAGVGAEYARTGYLWENYDDETGRGRGSHPFTGWTALIALVAADEV